MMEIFGIIIEFIKPIIFALGVAFIATRISNSFAVCMVIGILIILPFAIYEWIKNREQREEYDG